MMLLQKGKTAIALASAALAVYFVMVLGTLSHLTELAGAPPFDMRPKGYSVTEAADLLSAYGDTGRRYYLTRQIPLDTLYPALLALALMSALGWRASRFGTNLLTRLGVPLAILAASFDYLENIGLVSVLLSGPTVTPWLVQAASTATVLKSILTTAVVLCLIGAFAPLIVGKARIRRGMTRRS